MNILFICTGNSCRSPMAEHLFKKMLKDAHVTGVHVKSAGVEPSGFDDMTPEAREVLEKEGVTGAHHKSQGVTKAMVDHADEIYAMEEYHRQLLIHKFPSAAPKVKLINAKGIYDPYGRPLDWYKKTLKEIKEALEPLLKKIQSHK